MEELQCEVRLVSSGSCRSASEITFIIYTSSVLERWIFSTDRLTNEEAMLPVSSSPAAPPSQSLSSSPALCSLSGCCFCSEGSSSPVSLPWPQPSLHWHYHHLLHSPHRPTSHCSLLARSGDWTGYTETLWQRNTNEWSHYSQVCESYFILTAHTHFHMFDYDNNRDMKQPALLGVTRLKTSFLTVCFGYVGVTGNPFVCEPGLWVQVPLRAI